MRLFSRQAGRLLVFGSLLGMGLSPQYVHAQVKCGPGCAPQRCGQQTQMPCAPGRASVNSPDDDGWKPTNPDHIPMTPDPVMPPETTPPTPIPPETTPPTPMVPETTDPPPIDVPDTTPDFTNPNAPTLAFNAPQAGFGSPDAAFGGVPGMIGDQFGGGSGQISLPLIIGRAILHADRVNGEFTNFGINDFHVIDETINPVGFAGEDGLSELFFLPPQGTVFDRQANGDPIPPQLVTGLTTFDLEAFGFPPGLENDITFAATQTPDRVTVVDQGSSDIFPNTPVYLITRGNGSDPIIVLPTGSPGRGGVVVGRQKNAENTSPIPRNRVFFNYSYFDNTRLLPGGVNVNRYTPGFEKTFLDGLASLEFRLPFATTADSELLADGITDTSHLELGNAFLSLKGLLYSTNTYALSAGLSFALPTADDTEINLSNGTRLVKIENEAVHLLPFIAGVYSPNDRLFMQGFVQFDFDANGNTVNLNLTGNRLTEAGVINDAAFAFFDVGVGYWLYRNTTRNSFITGFAPTAELHYNVSLQESDSVRQSFYQIGNVQDDVQVLNALIGGTVQLGDSTSLTAAYVTPIGNSTDQDFDGEARISLNWFFGPSRFTGNSPLPFPNP